MGSRNNYNLLKSILLRAEELNIKCVLIRHKYAVLGTLNCTGVNDDIDIYVSHEDVESFLKLFADYKFFTIPPKHLYVNLDKTLR